MLLSPGRFHITEKSWQGKPPVIISADGMLAILPFSAASSMLPPTMMFAMLFLKVFRAILVCVVCSCAFESCIMEGQIQATTARKQGDVAWAVVEFYFLKAVEQHSTLICL